MNFHPAPTRPDPLLRQAMKTEDRSDQESHPDALFLRRHKDMSYPKCSGTPFLPKHEITPVEDES